MLDRTSSFHPVCEETYSFRMELTTARVKGDEEGT